MTIEKPREHNVLKLGLLLFLSFWLEFDLFSQKAQVEHGTIQIQHSELNEDPIDLRGDWEFYWKELLEPKDFENASRKKEFSYVPGNWSNREDNPQYGYGTYRVRINIDSLNPISIHLSSILSSSKVFVDGSLIYQKGVVSESSDDGYTANIGDDYITFEPSSKSFDIIIQVSNYDLYIGGMGLDVPSLASPLVHADERFEEGIGYFFMVGTLTVMAIYHISLWLLFNNAKSALFFGLFCLTMAYYICITTPMITFYFFPKLDYSIYIKLFNFWVLSTVFMSWFTYYVFPKLYSKRFAYFVTVSTGLYVLLVLTTEVKVFVYYTFLIQLVTVVVAVYIIFVAILAVQRKVPGAKLFLCGAIFSNSTAINDILQAGGVIESSQLGGLGTFIFTFCHSLLLARRFSWTYQELEKGERKIRKLSEDLRSERDQVKQLNDSLEKNVEEKIAEISSIMTHIKQGIFIFGEDLILEKHHSKYLEEIFESIDFYKETSVISIIESDSSLDKNEMKIIVLSLKQSFQKNVAEFDKYSDQLPRQLVTESRDEEKILELDWQAIGESDQTCQKIIVVVKDVTEVNTLMLQNQMEFLNSEIRVHSLNEQMKPHFLFNSLNVIDNLIMESPMEASNAIGKLSELYRYILKGAKQHFWSVEDEMTLIRDALAIQKIRFQERIDYFFDIEEGMNLESFYVPCLMLHTIVENSIKHAVLENPSGGTITVRIRQKDGGLELAVIDTGPGEFMNLQSESVGTGTGLENTRKRLHRIYGEKSNFVMNLDRKGSEVVFWISGRKH